MQIFVYRNLQRNGKSCPFYDFVGKFKSVYLWKCDAFFLCFGVVLEVNVIEIKY